MPTARERTSHAGLCHAFLVLHRLQVVLNGNSLSIGCHERLLQNNVYDNVQMITMYSPLTWGIYNEPPPDVPECGFVGELCLPQIRGKLACFSAGLPTGQLTNIAHGSATFSLLNI